MRLGQAFERRLSETGAIDHDQRTVPPDESKRGLASDLCLRGAPL